MTTTRLGTGFSVMIDELLSSPRERAAVEGAHVRAVEAHFYDIFRAVDEELPFEDIAALMTRATGLEFSGAALEAQYREVAHRKALRAMGAAAVARPHAQPQAQPRAPEAVAGRSVAPPAGALPARLARRAAPRGDETADGAAMFAGGLSAVTALDNITLAAPQVNIQGAGTGNPLTVQDISNADGVTVALVGGTCVPNQVLNSELAGAQIGPIGGAGSYPTGFGAWAAGGLSVAITGLGVDAATGYNYIDLRITGTPAQTYAVFAFEIVYDCVFDGQDWTSSFYYALPDATAIGNLGSIIVEARTNNTVAATGVTPQQGTTLNRLSTSVTLAENGSDPTIWIVTALEFDFLNTSDAVDFTFRLAGPQLELGSSASAFGPTPWKTLANKTINLGADSALTIASAAGAALLGLADDGALSLYGPAGATALQAPAGGGLGVYAGATEILGVSQSGVLSASVLASGAATSPRTLAAMAGQVVNVKDYGAVGDGVSDDYPAIAAAIAYATGAEGNPCVFFPPSAKSYLISQPISLQQAANVTIFAYPGTVTIAPVPNSTANPLLVNFVLSGNILVSGIAFDGGGAAFANASPAVQCYECPAPAGIAGAGVVFEDCRFQNIRGIGANISDCCGSGFRNCSFFNIGNYWKTSLSPNDRWQGIAFSNDKQSLYNFVSGCFFQDIGLDAISLGALTHVSITQNVMNLFNDQYNIIANSPSFGAGIYAEDCANLVIAGNVIDGAAGNGIDTSGLACSAISGNQTNFCGSAGILVAAAVPDTGGGNLFAQQRRRRQKQGAALPVVTGVIVSGNSCTANNQWSKSILLGGICVYQAADQGSVAQGQITSVSLSGNACADLTATPAQQYGIYAQCQSVIYQVDPMNCWIDQNNALAGNKVAPVGGMIGGVAAGYSVSRAGMQTITPVSPSGFLPMSLAGKTYYTQLYTTP